MRPGWRQHLAQLGNRLLRQLGETPSLVDQGVSCQDADSPAIGQDSQTVASRRSGQGQGFHGVEKLFEAVNAKHTGALERSVINRIRSGQSTGMGHYCPRTLGMPSSLHHDDGFHPCGGAGRGHEPTGILDGLDVEQDCACGDIIG
jgi:hypothetical protein